MCSLCVAKTVFSARAFPFSIMSCESPRCRLCLNRHNDPDSALDENLCRQLSSVCQLEIQLVPGLPDTLCNCCKADLAACVEFRQRCQKADRALRQQSPQLFAGASHGEPNAVVTVGATPSLPECQQLLPIAEQRCAAVVQSVSLESLDLANDTIVGEFLNHPGASLPRQASAPAPDESLRSELTETEDATHLSRPQGQRVLFGRSQSSRDLSGVIKIEARFVVQRRGAEPVEAVARQRRRLV